MVVFILIALAVLLGVLFCMVYVSFRTARFPFVQRLAGGRKRVAVLIAFFFYLLVSIALSCWMNVINAIICIIHFGGFWLLSELLFHIIGKVTRRKVRGTIGKAERRKTRDTVGETERRKTRDTIPGICAMVFTICYMAAAWYLCTHVRETDYVLESSKLTGNLRIVQIADSHMGATFDAQGLHDYILQINALAPDIVVITGDFVDDDTTREDMIGSCEALADLETKYGVFFCYGNHDKGYFSEDSRGWNNAEFLENLEKNGVTVLQDEAQLVEGRVNDAAVPPDAQQESNDDTTVLSDESQQIDNNFSDAAVPPDETQQADDRFYVLGRKDKSEEERGGSRKTPEELMADLDPDIYKIVLDHQPCEFDEEAQAGADLVLCGHTHGGQFFPFNWMGVLTRQYERSYGHERRGSTDFIVTSGISDWTLLFKTGCQSEYVCIDVHGTDGG